MPKFQDSFKKLQKKSLRKKSKDGTAHCTSFAKDGLNFQFRGGLGPKLVKAGVIDQKSLKMRFK